MYKRQPFYQALLFRGAGSIRAIGIRGVRGIHLNDACGTGGIHLSDAGGFRGIRLNDAGSVRGIRLSDVCGIEVCDVRANRFLALVPTGQHIVQELQIVLQKAACQLTACLLYTSRCV